MADKQVLLDQLEESENRRRELRELLKSSEIENKSLNETLKDQRLREKNLEKEVAKLCNSMEGEQKVFNETIERIRAEHEALIAQKENEARASHDKLQDELKSKEQQLIEATQRAHA